MKTYILGLALLIRAVAVADDLAPGPLPESTPSTVGFRTVAEALTSLKGRKDVSASTQGGWLIFSDNIQSTIWSFSQAGYPAYPAVVKRVLHQNGNGISLEMSILCEATKDACDQLVRDFDAMNKKMRESLQHRR
jgi:hypothetical protein